MGDDPALFQIRVSGHLGPTLLTAFPAFVPQQQGAETRPPFYRIRITDNHHFLPLAAFAFEPARITRDRPVSSRPRSDRNSPRSSGAMVTISASIAAETITAAAPSAAAF